MSNRVGQWNSQEYTVAVNNRLYAQTSLNLAWDPSAYNTTGNPNHSSADTAQHYMQVKGLPADSTVVDCEGSSWSAELYEIGKAPKIITKKPSFLMSKLWGNGTLLDKDDWKKFWGRRAITIGAVACAAVGIPVAFLMTSKGTGASAGLSSTISTVSSATTSTMQAISSTTAYATSTLSSAASTTTLSNIATSSAATSAVSTSTLAATTKAISTAVTTALASTVASTIATTASLLTTNLPTLSTTRSRTTKINNGG